MSDNPTLYQCSERSYQCSEQPKLITFLIPWDGFDNPKWAEMIVTHFKAKPKSHIVAVEPVFFIGNARPLCRVEPLMDLQGNATDVYLVSTVGNDGRRRTSHRVRDADGKVAKFAVERLGEVFARLYALENGRTP
jgi:hypothetical protein